MAMDLTKKEVRALLTEWRETSIENVGTLYEWETAGTITRNTRKRVARAMCWGHSWGARGPTPWSVFEEMVRSGRILNCPNIGVVTREELFAGLGWEYDAPAKERKINHRKLILQFLLTISSTACCPDDVLGSVDLLVRAMGLDLAGIWDVSDLASLALALGVDTDLNGNKYSKEA